MTRPPRSVTSKPVDGVVDHRLDQRIAGVLAGERAGCRRRARTARTRPTMRQQRQQRQDIGSGIAAADEQQADRRADQRDRDQQHHADAAASCIAGMAAINGRRPVVFRSRLGWPCLSLKFWLDARSGECDATQRSVPWCLREGQSRKRIRNRRSLRRHSGAPRKRLPMAILIRPRLWVERARGLEIHLIGRDLQHLEAARRARLQSAHRARGIRGLIPSGRRSVIAASSRAGLLEPQRRKVA